MQLIFDHIHGRQEQQDLQYFWMRGIPNGEEDDEDPMESGWLCDDVPFKGHEVWYQSRSTRVFLGRRVSKPSSKRYLHEGRPLEMIEIKPTSMLMGLTSIENIYYDFIKKKGFRDLYHPLKHLHPRDYFLMYYQGDLNNVLGFTKIKKYYDDEQMAYDRFNIEENYRHIIGIESVLHCNLVDIGAMTLKMEIDWARQSHCSHFYLGPGYEKSSIYKSKLPGFEWWTGSRWSRDVKLYQSLCERDSRLNQISELFGLRAR